MSFFNDPSKIDPNGSYSTAKLTDFIRRGQDGHSVREAIAMGIEKVYDDASENGNANMEVKIARGTHPNLRSRLDEVDNKQQQTTAQLAQNATKEELQTGLDSKVGRGENESVSWGMLDQAAKENVSGDKVAVVGKDSVNTENIVDKATTFSKRTALGNMGVLTLSAPFKKPNINSIAKTITFYENTRVNWGNKTYRIESDVLLDLTQGAFPGIKFILFDTDTELFVQRTGRDLSEASESELMIATINWTSNNLERIVNISSSIDILLDGEAFQPEKKGLGDLGTYSISPSANSKKPNIDTHNKTLTFYASNPVAYRDTLFEGFEQTIALDEGSFPGNQFIFFDTSEQKFVRLNSYELTNANEDMVLIMTISWDSNEQDSLVNVFSMNAYTINGYDPLATEVENIVNDLFDETGGQIKNFSLPPEPIDTNYFPTDRVYEELEEPDDLHRAYQSLIEKHPEYLSRKLEGKDATGTYDVYTYRTTVSDVANHTPKNVKAKPKIVITAGVHGHEKSSVYSLYYLIKDICENWKEHPTLEYLRWNVELVFNPLVNPYGFSSSPDYERQNGNGVDLNRNHAFLWESSDPEEWNYTGDYAQSEPETQYVAKMIDDNTDALFFCDYHTNGSSVDYSDYKFMMFIGLSVQGNINQNMFSGSKFALEKTTQQYIKHFNLPSNEGMYGHLNLEDHGGDTKSYAWSKGLPTAVVETCMAFPNVGVRFTPEVIQGSTMYFGIWLASCINQFNR